jgi:hypothetical protein
MSDELDTTLDTSATVVNNEESEATTENEQTPEQIEEAETKSKNWAQKRINELTREKYEARRLADDRAEEARQIREFYEVKYGQQQSQQQPDLTGYVQLAAQALVQTEKFNDRCNSVYDQGVKEFKGDFDTALSNLSMVELDPSFVEAVTESDQAAKVLYHLANNLDEAERISRLPPFKMARELTKLEIQLGQKPARQVSNAPEPIHSLQSRSKGNKSVTQMSDDEFDKWVDQGKGK